MISRRGIARGAGELRQSLASLVGTVEFSLPPRSFRAPTRMSPGAARPGGLAGAVRVPRAGGRPGRRLCWGLLTALLLVPTLAGAIITVGASLAVQTLNETGFRVCLALALYGVAPTITLAAVLVLARAQRGRVFLAGLALGAALLVPAGIALASLVG